MSKISVKDFIKEYKKAVNKDDYLRGHILNNYIPFEKKKTIADDVVNSTHYIEVNGQRVFHPDSNMEQYKTDLWMINLYTDLDMGVDGSEILANYNLLCENGIVKTIVEMLGSTDFDVLSVVIWNASSDDCGRNNSVVNWLDGKLAGVGVFANSLLDTIEKIASDEKMMNKLTKAIEKMAK